MAETESALLERLSGVDTTSLVDAGRGLRVLPPSLRPVRAGLRFVGRAVTVEARDDLMPMLAGLQMAGSGDVLVAAGSDQHAVAGEVFASEAQRRGLAAMVIDGLCRDRPTLAGMDFPVWSRGSVPTACPARGIPVVQVPILVGSVEVRPGDLMVGDDDGIVVGAVEEMAAAIDGAETIQARETGLREAIQGGASIFDHLNYLDHLAALRAGRESKLIFS